MSTVRTAVLLDEKVNEDIQNAIYKPRKHPGVMKYKNVQLPIEYIKAMENSIQDFPIKKLVNDGQELNRYLAGRHPPPTQLERRDKYEQIRLKILEKSKYKFTDDMPEEERVKQEKFLHNEIMVKCNKQIYGWKPMSYDDLGALTYMFGRSAQEYAVLVRIFGEIYDRVLDFKPKSFLDFGSGVGTGTWAVNHFWKSNIFEYFCVDSSSSMNDLADIILKGGRGNKLNPIKGISYRQFLPAAREIRYDIVLCAYTLFEMSTPELRLEKLVKLWNKTEQFLVIVEMGTNAGFRLISEARDFLLQYDAEIFAPCPHSKPCPRFMTDETPCNFEVKYSTIPLAAVSQIKTERFSYIVLRKKAISDSSTDVLTKKKLRQKLNRFSSEREESIRNLNIDKKESTSDEVNVKSDEEVYDDKGDSVTCTWPRIVRPTLVRSKHTVCRMCTSDGQLKEVVVTAAKHGKTAYHCVRSSKWGDLLPVTLTEVEKKSRFSHSDNETDE
ncbi:methyltransferase-like protein 17, mitochondrial [Ctenocephalides felis]|uniref:methyltransferase-like protein 17, mitochondrial n=1 Tax=Ctenocephalides felis TaxID=7515 RepID=UPI000E6E15A1|nr:methyltransferase-like protein 17, mitochondrial [Ctenocephalides felis]